MVEKIVPSGYRILNGHHRWMAALNAGVKKISVQIVNVTSDEAIFKIVRESTRTKCVSFDLDEVLLRDGKLRKNAGNLISGLRNMGFDVWIYTGEYYSEEYIRRLVRKQHSKVDGIINGISKKKSRQNIKDAFSKKYLNSVHIDTQTKEYDMKEVQSQDSNWASEVLFVSPANPQDGAALEISLQQDLQGAGEVRHFRTDSGPSGAWYRSLDLHKFIQV